MVPPWKIAADAAEAKKAVDLVVLDLSGVSSIADHFLICSGTSRRQLQAILEAILKAMKEAGHMPHHQEGGTDSQWFLVDYGDLVVHLFDHQGRKYYALDRLWDDAAKLYASGGDEV